MPTFTLRHLILGTVACSPVLLGGCVVEPSGYYQTGYAAAPAPATYYYPGPAYVEPAPVYVGVGIGGRGYWRGGDGWHDHGWRR